MDWRIKLVAVVDRKGKLLVGQNRAIPLNYANYKHVYISRTSSHVVNSKTDDLVEFSIDYKNMYLFYSDYLPWVMGNCIAHIKNHEIKHSSCVPMHINEVSPFFEISGESDGDVKLAVTPLNVIRKTFLRIYFEPAYNINEANTSEEGLNAFLNRIYSTA